MNIHENNLVTVEPIPEDMESAARSLGFERVPAWVSKKPEKAGAKRSKRAREKAATQGVKQLSVALPTHLHEFFKTLASRTKSGEHMEIVLSELMPALQGQTTEKPTSPGVFLAGLPGWRRWLLQLLLPAEFIKG